MESQNEKLPNTTGTEESRTNKGIVTDPVLEKQFSLDTDVHHSPEGQISHYALCDTEN